MKRIITLFFAVICLSTNAKNNQPKNIIMIIGDGMGPAYTTAYRYFNDNPITDVVENTVFDRHLVGMSSTYPAKVSGVVTDSAASATALATGIKSYNGAIGVDVNKKPLETVLAWAKQQGKKTGIVVTSQINHATPAAYLAHNESRHNYNKIADSYFNNHQSIDLILGGGWQYFIREEINLVEKFKQAGFFYLDKYDDLKYLTNQSIAQTTLNNKPSILGLFADKGLPWALDDSNKYRLSTMTKAATQYLSNDNGFFMLIEASQIDWAGHNNDIAAAMAEMDDLAKTVEYLEDYVNNHPDTLVILTADHSTGGVSVAANGKYIWQPDILRTMVMSPNSIAKKLSTQRINKALTTALFNFALTEDELNHLIVDKRMAEQTALKESLNEAETSQYLVRTLYKSINELIDNRTNTGWTSGGHTAIDVPVFAFGAQYQRFYGYQDNIDIAKKIFNLLGKKTVN